MPKVMILVGSVRPGRVGLPVANWVRSVAETDGRFEVDFADLAAIRLPLMDEPNHPKLRQYTQQHTLDWSARVAAADGFLFVVPEYNYSYAPAVKNAIDYLSAEWAGKPVAVISYGGISAGTRGVVALRPVLSAVGLLGTRANVEISYVAKRINDSGDFEPTEVQEKSLAAALNELVALDGALRPLRG